MYKIHPKTLFIGQKSNYLPSCQSTNDEAADLISHSDPPEGTLVITDNQLAGRGQRGNRWQATAGQNLTVSLILRPHFLTASEQFWLNIAVSVGISNVLSTLGDGAFRIKWPNDLYIGNQKLGGLLIENTIQGQTLAWSVVGMGMNVNQTDFSYSTATSLQNQFPLPEGYHLPGLLSQLCEGIEQAYLLLKAGHRSTLKATYLQRLLRYQEDQRYRYTATGEAFWGRIIDVDDHGRLIMRVNEQIKSIYFKEIEFIFD